MLMTASFLSILVLDIIPLCVLVLLVQNRNSACGHARNRNQRIRFISQTAA